MKTWKKNVDGKIIEVCDRKYAFYLCLFQLNLVGYFKIARR